jgi:signal transduction histidine kinase
LTPVLIVASAMEKNASLPQSVRDDAQMIRENVRLETAMIDDLLDLSRIMSGKLHLQFEPVDLNDAVLQACANCRHLVQHKGIRLFCTLDENVDQVHADPGRLQQLFASILKNAVKFTPAGGSIHVMTRNLENGRYGISSGRVCWVEKKSPQGSVLSFLRRRGRLPTLKAAGFNRSVSSLQFIGVETVAPARARVE